MMHQAGFMAEAADNVAALVGTPDAGGRAAVDDGSVAYRLGRSVARLEARRCRRPASSAGWRWHRPCVTSPRI